MKLSINKEEIAFFGSYKVSENTKYLNIPITYEIQSRSIETTCMIFQSIPYDFEFDSYYKTKKPFKILFVDGDFDLILSPLENDNLHVEIEIFNERDTKLNEVLSRNEFRNLLAEFWNEFNTLFISLNEDPITAESKLSEIRNEAVKRLGK